jgi:RND superfamily putative drug exporter
MPLLTAGLALAIGTSLIDLLTHAFDVASVSTDLAVLIGLGVGVDYGLFIISRHRSAVKAACPTRTPPPRPCNTSGRTVLFAGMTVCIALLGQFALGVSFLYGLSLASAIAVALTMAASLTFLPAMLGFLGPKVLSRRERAAPGRRRAAGTDEGPASGCAGPVRPGPQGAGRRGRPRRGRPDRPADPRPAAGHLRRQHRPAGSPPTRPTPPWPRGSGPGSTDRSSSSPSGSPADTAAFANLLKTAPAPRAWPSVTAATTSPNGKVMLATVYPTTSPQASRPSAWSTPA